MTLLVWLAVHVGWWSVGVLETVVLLALVFGGRALLNRHARIRRHHSRL